MKIGVVTARATDGHCKRRPWQYLLVLVGLVFCVGFAVPDVPIIPVQGASPHDWNPKSFWFEPWGASGVHKGIDIFAREGTTVRSATPGVVIYGGRLGIGGNVVAVLGPRWRIHYYAHLGDGALRVPVFVSRGEQIGQVGTTGNAAGKPPHLHYSVISILPLPWRYSTAIQGWQRMFYLDPGPQLRTAD